MICIPYTFNLASNLMNNVKDAGFSVRSFIVKYLIS
jgi:hypothetical protein